jgi:DNA invertase Pin-like site-specific DNA recombinase
MNTPSKWALYARKSSESEDRQVNSIPDQIAVLTQLAYRSGVISFETYTDEKSAKAPYVRTGFQNLLKDIEKGSIDGIICWKLDRLSRNPIDSAQIQWMLQKEKIKCIKTFDREYKPQDNAIVFAVEQGMANQWIRELSSNVKRALEQKVDRGWYPCMAKIGYLNQNDGTKAGGIIIKDPDRFVIVRKMWDMILTGCYTVMDVYRIATKEWKLNVPKRGKYGHKPITIAHIYRLFNDIFYTGNFYYKGKFHQGNHPAMITMDEFERVQTFLHNKQQTQPIRHQFPFTGIMKCTCGSAITATGKTKKIKATGELKTFTYYHCTRKKARQICTEPPISIGDLMKQINEVLESNTIGEAFYTVALGIINQWQEKTSFDCSTIINQQKTELAAMEKKLGRLLGFLLNGTLTEEEYIDQKKDLENKIAIEKIKVGNLDARLKPFSKEIENVFHFCRANQYALNHGDYLTQKEILLHYGSNQRLTQKNLCIDTFGWFHAVKQGEKIFTDKFGALELEKLNNDKLKSRYATFFPTLGEILEAVRTELIKIPNHYIPDLSRWVEQLSKGNSTASSPVQTSETGI